MSEKCIYCGEQKPFTAEHVIPAGIGGDDRNWLLTDCVCGECNTRVFSPLETKTFRSSPLALARIYLQPETRGKTGKSSAPIIQPQVDYHVDPQTEIRFEQVTHSGGQPVMLPQIAAIPGGELIVNIPSAEIGQDFLDDLRRLLSQQIRLIRKFRDGMEAKFEQMTLDWTDDTTGYQINSPREITSKAPPAPVVWLEEPVWPSGVTADDYSRLPPRIFRREGGQICCRVRDEATATALLSLIRSEISNIAIPLGVKPIASQAKTNQKYAFDIKIYNRVLAKIGFNLCAKLFGAEFVRQNEFDQIRNFIYSGQGDIKKKFAGEADPARNAFGPPLKNHHVFMLSAGPGKDAQSQCLVFFSRVYGGPVEITRFAEFTSHQKELKDRIVIVADYLANKCSRMTLEDYVVFAVQNSFVPIEEFLDENAPKS